MFKKEALTITAFKLTLFLTFLVAISTKSVYAIDSNSNCREIDGRFYITNEYYKVCKIFQNPQDCSGFVNLNSYSTKEQCTSASIEKYGCTPAINNLALYGYTTDTQASMQFVNRVVSPVDAGVCLKSLSDGTPINPNQPYCKNGIRFYQCKCSKTLVGETGVFGDIINWVTGMETYSCYLTPIREPKIVKLEPVQVYSPIMLINSSTNLMFYLAVVIFIINLVRVGTMYIQSEGIPDDLKKAQELLSNTLKGMVFFLLVIGLVGYLIDAFRI